MPAKPELAIDADARSMIHAVDAEVKVLSKGLQGVENRLDDHLAQSRIFEAEMRAGNANIVAKIDDGHEKLGNQMNAGLVRIHGKFDKLMWSILGVTITVAGYFAAHWIQGVG